MSEDDAFVPETDVSVTIRRAENGWIVETVDGPYVFGDPDDLDTGDVPSLRDALYQVIDSLGADSGDHADRRLYLVVAPGDEREDYPRTLDRLLYPDEEWTYE